MNQGHEKEVKQLKSKHAKESASIRNSLTKEKNSLKTATDKEITSLKSALEKQVHVSEERLSLAGKLRTDVSLETSCLNRRLTSPGPAVAGS